MKQPNAFVFLEWLIDYITPYKWLCLILLLLNLGESGSYSSLRFSFKLIIEAVQETTKETHLFMVLWLLVGEVMFYTIISVMADFFWARFGTLVINEIRRKLFNHIQNLSVDFFSRRKTGDILNCFVADILLLEEELGVTLSTAISSLTTVIVSILFLLSLNFSLTIYTTIGILISLLGPNLINGKAIQLNYTLREQEGILASNIQQKLLGQALIKLFGIEKKICEDFSVQLEDLKNIAIPAKFFKYTVSRLPFILFLLLQLIIIIISSFLITKGSLSISEFAAFQVLLLGLEGAIGNLSWIFPSLVNQAAVVQRIEQLLQETPSVQDAPNAVELPRFQKNICFQQVTFHYSKERPIIDNISLNFEKGKLTAIVGPSGSGKSTLVNLLVRFYDCNHGRILFDKIDIREVSQASLRSQIAVVSQETILFNCSISDNIRLGNLTINNKEIETAAKAAEINDFIESLPEGYNTIIGERGMSLSGGQKQRIALARALAKNPEILILDEATSALDAITEAKILETIKHIAKDLTIINITHRLNQAIEADLIYVLKEGHLEQSGKHYDLIQQEGLYANLWK
ncbi:MAG: ABC transporter ATP-binding protein [Symploca sp. SIO1C4]|uniref:ABC transporter ATP-binding protein n=1 Tax=Symploca sp. SIO1C4 TaxID=2607765 RepID=A0A6B3NB70_9CYAN|nr:ABC transporter ATP-binding protein [Symploca sp. SIO1C4]